MESPSAISVSQIRAPSDQRYVLSEQAAYQQAQPQYQQVQPQYQQVQSQYQQGEPHYQQVQQQQAPMVTPIPPSARPIESNYWALYFWSFMSLAFALGMVFIAEQFSRKDNKATIGFSVVAYIFSFPVPVLFAYPLLNSPGAPRKLGFPRRVMIGMFLYIAALMLAIIFVMRASLHLRTISGTGVVSVSFLLITTLLLYIDQPHL
jgi:hypothetical protein